MAVVSMQCSVRLGTGCMQHYSGWTVGEGCVWQFMGMGFEEVQIKLAQSLFCASGQTEAATGSLRRAFKTDVFISNFLFLNEWVSLGKASPWPRVCAFAGPGAAGIRLVRGG